MVRLPACVQTPRPSRPAFHHTLLSATVAVLLSAAAGFSLERMPVPDGGIDDGAWAMGRTTGSVAYYNICTGWAWVWGGFPAEASMGVVFDVPDYNPVADGTYFYFWRGAEQGYGATGQISLHSVDADGCPSGEALITQPFLPTSGWNLTHWGEYIPSTVAAVITLGSAAGSHGSSPVWITSDRPGPGPTGPIACGTCYPTTRETHSFYWGTEESPLCPGSTFYDGFCDAELLAILDYSGVQTALESHSWGSIKALYR